MTKALHSYRDKVEQLVLYGPVKPNGDLYAHQRIELRMQVYRQLANRWGWRTLRRHLPRVKGYMDRIDYLARRHVPAF